MQFRLGSLPVRVQGSFFFMAAVLGAADADAQGGRDLRNVERLVLWVVAAFVAVLVHELGHAVVGRMFGLAPTIDLHGMGGTTSFAALPGRRGRERLGTLPSILVSVAGPGAGLLLAMALRHAGSTGHLPPSRTVLVGLGLLLTLSWYWSLFNLLPMLPLDGGNVLATAARALSPRHGLRVALAISLLVAAAFALWSGLRQEWWSLVLALSFLVQNAKAMRSSGR